MGRGGATKADGVRPTTAYVRVLVTGGDEAASSLCTELGRDGYACDLASSLPGALQVLTRRSFDALVVDPQSAGTTSPELLDALAMRHPTLPVVLLTDTGAAPAQSTRPGPFDQLARPFTVAQLEDVIARAIRERWTRGVSPPGTEAAGGPPSDRRSAPPRAVLSPELLGSEPVIAALLDRIECAAAASAPVLIGGESGSGKDLVAHAIHARGPRRDRPFVAINASAIPEALLESEMFGHARGAFSGASDARPGLFLTAQGGTLFLDEIGDMPIGLQAKLLRVLELGEVRAVGSDSVRTVNVRVIAATHRDMPKLIEAGRFRTDLYFRLNVLPISVPPLRDRRGDIPQLALHFLEQARRRAPASPVQSFEPDALAALASMPWPGNVRELASVIERLVVFGREATISRASLSPVAEQVTRYDAPPTCEVCAARQPCTLRELSERHVAWVLRHTRGDKVRAAEILGINVSTLYRWRRRRPE